MKNNKLPRNLAAACALLLASSPVIAETPRYVGERDTENRFHGWGVYTYLAGGKYEGEWQYGQKDGMGRRDWPDGSRYEGEWRNNQPHGKGIKTYKDGAQYTGDFRQGLRAGKGKMSWPNGASYSGEWKDDQMQGEGSKRLADGSQYDGHFSKGQRDGWGTYVYTDKTRYEGDWKNDLQEGKGTLRFPDGGVYVGEFRQGHPHGKGELTYASGDRYKGDWEKGTLSGQGTLRYAKGGIYEGQWERGLRNGQGQWTSAAGTAYTGPFVNDKPHGKGSCTEKGATFACRYEYGRRLESNTPTVAAAPSPAAAKAIVAANATAAIPKAAAPVTSTPISAAAPAAAVNAALSAAPTAAGKKFVSSSMPTPEQTAVAAPIQSQDFIQSVTSAKVKLSPEEQLSKIGSGIYFKHPFEKLALAQPPSFSWWTKETALFSENLRLHLVRGRDMMQIDIISYNGPGEYEGNDYKVQLLKEGKLYSLAPNTADKIKIEEDANGWLKGQFTATLISEKGGQASRLDSGVFRLSGEKPAAAATLTDVQMPRKPLMEAAVPLMKELPLVKDLIEE